MRNEPIASFRSFGRSFSQAAGLLRPAPYDPSLTLLESRVIFELSDSAEPRAADLVQRLSMDKGYLSRTISSLAERGIIRRQVNPADARERSLSLTPRGRRLFGKIDRVSTERARSLLEPIGEERRQELIRHLLAAEIELNPRRRIPIEEVRLRGLEAGDMGWVISRHGEIYRREFDWNMDFELLVAGIVADFAKNHDPARERAWIACARGLRLGCVFLVEKNRETAQLRILLVDPIARGVGVGSLLVDECLRFAEKAGYKRVVLWTNSVLISARKIYAAAGFVLDREQRHRSFGKNLVGQFWSKDLRGTTSRTK